MHRNLSASQAAAALGVSVKALRLYERAGLIAPGRSAAGWRIYAPDEMVRAREIAALRGLGVALREIGPMLDADPGAGLARHEARLRSEAARIAEAIGRLRAMRPADEEEATIAFDLPWPWGGERFELRGLPPILWLTGPLGSGKTRLAMRIAESLPSGRFVGLERDRPIEALIAEGEGPLVIDMVEEGLDADEQVALAARLRARPVWARPLVLMTRSSAMLDLGMVGAGEAIILCPANHSPPVYVDPVPGAPGYEALATCLAAPELRARTAGVIAIRG
ncbi:MerR family transcriptional regulator [Sphingomonas montanisoli]|uniref:MerR family transcriptional regulator n=1 Tax=Sphingomonas montanisoli TaxID=2606412 RepID=A0A5D9CCK8_9SPHN|nr:MerR family transcriptional regulator [Sphingomonas montanisoli]TZG27835.1 MerR family transcriptional regulator [Sphingomonas montanisoli]